MTILERRSGDWERLRVWENGPPFPHSDYISAGIRSSVLHGTVVTEDSIDFFRYDCCTDTTFTLI